MGHHPEAPFSKIRINMKSYYYLIDYRSKATGHVCASCDHYGHSYRDAFKKFRHLGGGEFVVYKYDEDAERYQHIATIDDKNTPAMPKWFNRQ